MTLAAGPLSRIAPVSVLLQLRSILDAADPRDLLLIGHDERRRLADTLRAWAYATDEADRLARAEATLTPVLERLDRLGAGRPYRQSQKRTHCKRGHLLAGDNIVIRDGVRRCRTCRCALQNEARRRLRASRKAVLAQLAEHAP